MQRYLGLPPIFQILSCQISGLYKAQFCASCNDGQRRNHHTKSLICQWPSINSSGGSDDFCGKWQRRSPSFPRTLKVVTGNYSSKEEQDPLSSAGLNLVTVIQHLLDTFAQSISGQEIVPLTLVLGLSHNNLYLLSPGCSSMAASSWS